MSGSKLDLAALILDLLLADHQPVGRRVGE